MSKYEIIKNKTDDYTLKYKDKEINFKSDVDVISKMQSANKQARVKMVMDMTKEGVSIKDLTIEKKENGKTYLDNSNKNEMEQAYIEEETANIFNKICEQKFNMDLASLMLDIGLEESEMENFALELIKALTGKTPSGR